MEDILSSIRRVIAREDGAEAAPPRGDAPAPQRLSRQMRADLDVLELGDAADAGLDGTPDQLDTAASVDPLVAPHTAQAAQASLASLNAALGGENNAEPPAAQPDSAARSLEAVMVDALRPMLKDWLDQNLPPLVERLVAAEIARIAGRK